MRNVTHVFYDCSELRDISQTSTSVPSYDNKTEYFPVVHKTAAALVVDSVIRVGDATITSSRYVRNLGLIIDTSILRNKCQASSVCAHSNSAILIR